MDLSKIKFRGRTINGEWVYGLLAHTEDKRICRDIGYFISNSAGCPFAYQVIPETIGRYTGVDDIDGVEIYENDLVEYTLDSEGTPIIGLVEYIVDGFTLEKRRYPIYLKDAYNKRVLGKRTETVLL